jgi:predicted amino acid racemase
MPTPDEVDYGMSLTLAAHNAREAKRYLKLVDSSAQLNNVEKILHHLGKVVQLMPQLGNATVTADRAARLARVAHADIRSAEDALAGCLIRIDEAIEYINTQRRRPR